MRISVTYPILSHMLGYIEREQLHKCQLMTLDVQVCLLTSWHEANMSNNVIRLHNGLQVATCH